MVHIAVLATLLLHLIVPSKCIDLDATINFAVRRYTQLSEQLSEDDPSTGFITTADPMQRTWYKTDVMDWTVGFYGGSLWTLYALTNDNHWRYLAEEYQERINERQHDTSTHDVGFVIMTTYGLCREYTGNETVAVIKQTAESLSTRFYRSYSNFYFFFFKFEFTKAMLSLL